MTRLIISVCIAAGLISGCGERRANVPVFDGEQFRASAKRESRAAPQDFTVTVRGASKSLDGARQAGAHAGIGYCIQTYGTSDIDWTVGPDADASAVLSDRDRLILTGSCRF